VALEVGIVGLPGSGKTTVFNALTRAGGGAARANVGVAPIADERLQRVADVFRSRKVTAATIRVVDVPGSGAALLGNMRQVDALLVVLDAFSGASDADSDLETLRLELLVADRDHVQRRLERQRKTAKSGDRALRDEVEQLERALAHVEAGGSLADYPDRLPEGLDPLTTKPLIPLLNGPDGIDAKLEAELAELSPEDAEAFREGPSALGEVVGGVFTALGLITFFTAEEKETRAWTLRGGSTALDAAATIHTDIARGFIRCEVIRWSDLVEHGSRAEVVRHGLQRLEGKDYVVEDGDILHIRFAI
jgi:ribosome-binding ATPase